MIPRETLKKIRRIEIRTRRAVSDLFAGRYQSVFKGEGMEFQEVREYLPGDDIRTIMHYYADPAQPNIDNIRVTDLI